MNKIIHELIKLSPDAIIPSYAHDIDAGMDISSVETYTLNAMERKLFSTGLAISIPEGYEIQLRPRSGNAYKFGITVLNSPATIDAGYLNEYKILLINLSDTPYTVNKGDRIAQMVLMPVTHIEFNIVDKFTVKSDRNLSGFGDSGK